MMRDRALSLSRPIVDTIQQQYNFDKLRNVSIFYKTWRQHGAPTIIIIIIIISFSLDLRRVTSHSRSRG